MSDQPSMVSGALKRPFAEQVAFFRQKMGNRIPTNRWDDITRAQRDKAFMVAGARKADLLHDLSQSIDRAISQGTGIEAFRNDFKQAVKKHDWHGWTGEGSKAGQAWRTRIIYRTNASTAYAAGRYAQLQEGGFDVWIYHHNDSVTHPRPQHVAWNGVVLPASDPFWQSHYPPNGWGCHCYVTGAYSTDAAARQGGQPGKPLPDDWNKTNPKTGEPYGIAKGWGYAPGASVADTVATLSKKLKTYPARLGADFYRQSMTNGAQSALQESWQTFFANAQAHRTQPRGGQMIVGALSPTTLKQLQATHPDMLPASAEIVITDKAISHMLRDKKFAELGNAWLNALPAKLRQPDAVLLDHQSPTPDLLLVYYTDNTKLVVKLDYQLKKRGKNTNVNLLKTGRVLDEEAMTSIKGNLKSGEYELLEGDL